MSDYAELCSTHICGDCYRCNLKLVAEAASKYCIDLAAALAELAQARTDFAAEQERANELRALQARTEADVTDRDRTIATLRAALAHRLLDTAPAPTVKSKRKARP